MVSVEVTQTREDQPLHALTEIPKRIVAAEKPHQVDVITRATVTSSAVINATLLALSKAR
ncbi:MAG: FMN-binding protein [Planctomycetota bacterium]